MCLRFLHRCWLLSSFYARNDFQPEALHVVVLTTVVDLPHVLSQGYQENYSECHLK